MALIVYCYNRSCPKGAVSTLGVCVCRHLAFFFCTNESLLLLTIISTQWKKINTKVEKSCSPRIAWWDEGDGKHKRSPSEEKLGL